MGFRAVLSQCSSVTCSQKGLRADPADPTNMCFGTHEIERPGVSFWLLGSAHAARRDSERSRRREQNQSLMHGSVGHDSKGSAERGNFS